MPKTRNTKTNSAQPRLIKNGNGAGPTTKAQLSSIMKSARDKMRKDAMPV